MRRLYPTWNYRTFLMAVHEEGKGRAEVGERRQAEPGWGSYVGFELLNKFVKLF